MNPSSDFDLVVLGAGSGGLAAAQRAAEYGARVAIADPGPLGGTCVNVGCVPKKMMWYAASLHEAIHDAAGYAIETGPARCDFALLKQRRDAAIARLHTIYATNLEKKGIVRFDEAAAFEGPRSVRLAGSGRLLRAERILIATGARPHRPEIEGAELGDTSDGFFGWRERPQRVIVVGAGYIAVELAGVLNALGSSVDLLARGDVLLRPFDPMVQATLAREMAASGVRLHFGAVPAACRRAEDGTLSIETADGHRIGPADAVLWATGRVPHTEALGLDRAGVACDAAGHVQVDDWQDTNVPGIHAVGDVTGRVPLTPVAVAAGRRLADRLYGGMADRRLSYENIATVVFSHPPVGTVGLTEPQARARDPQAEVRTAGFVPLYHALTERRPRMEMKLVLSGPERRVVGAHVIGLGADEMMQGFAVAVKMGATLQDLQDTVAIHPTAAEEFVTMR